MSDQVKKAWICNVCGYVHRGPEPPDTCPVCGASSDDFEPYEEAPEAPAAVSSQWRCLVCDYVHQGDVPPEKCPLCSAPAGRFEPFEGAGPDAEGDGACSRAVVIGGGIAAVSAVEALHQAAPHAEITMISTESGLPYYRLNLTRYLAGEVQAEDLPIHPESWYGDNNAHLRMGTSVDAIDLDGRQVALADGAAVSFEKLIIAAGAHPFMPPIPGASREGVFTVRTILDADALLAAVSRGGRCVCLGGGILGLETAGALAKRGVQVELLEGVPRLLPRQLNEQAAEILEGYVNGLGIKVRTGVSVEAFLGDERIRAVRLEDGAEIPADAVCVTTGVRPNSYLARRAGLRVNHGIIVDNLMRTSHPDVFAAGDVAEHGGILYGLWMPALYQGSMAGANAAGTEREFGGMPRANTLKVLGLDLFSIGVAVPEDASYRSSSEEREGGYFHFVFRDTHLVGAILLGDTSLAAAVSKAIEHRADFSALLRGRPSVAAILGHLAQNAQ